ncbi:Hachiman antiphage defense system protein HamA [Sphingobacterium cellulitidis]|uniref:Hachiman antiphage defense system protein HamA n=1 Tax=Sphingobacterium cellulitidis TaxID=1768011 RepID=UPI003C7D0169
MTIEGVKQIDKPNCTLYIIENFSEEFKQIIRDQLQGIWSGFAMADSLPEYYSYKVTLQSFMDRYNPKDDKTKKGMIGELLAHILINHTDNNLTSLSILKNKEDKSIKKGFDIIYCETDCDKLWYSEVKSGKSETGKEDSNSYNEILLNRAKTGINEMILEKRNSLWESALIDVELVIKESNGKLNLKELLSKDSPILKKEQKKNVILISSLYHNISDCIDQAKLVVFHHNTIQENLFNEIKIISIQKEAFETVANFLANEILVS